MAEQRCVRGRAEGCRIQKAGSRKQEAGSGLDPTSATVLVHPHGRLCTYGRSSNNLQQVNYIEANNNNYNNNGSNSLDSRFSILDFA